MANGSGNVNSVSQTGNLTPESGVSMVLPVSGNITFKDQIALLGWANTSDTDAYRMLQSAKSPGATAQYQVSTGKTFYVTGIFINFTAVSAITSFDIGYGTAALASDGTATPPTGDVLYTNSGAATNQGTFSFASNTDASTMNSKFLPLAGISFPADSYPYLLIRTSADSAGIILVGYEE